MFTSTCIVEWFHKPILVVCFCNVGGCFSKKYWKNLTNFKKHPPIFNFGGFKYDFFHFLPPPFNIVGSVLIIIFECWNCEFGGAPILKLVLPRAYTTRVQVNQLTTGYTQIYCTYIYISTVLVLVQVILTNFNETLSNRRFAQVERAP